MRIDASQPSVVIAPTSSAAPSRSFRAELARSASPAPLSPDAARALLGNAWTHVVGEAPNPQTAALLTAHWALETDGGRAMPGHNFAGIKAGPHAPGAALRTVEGYGATRHEISARFRVYDSAEAGAQDYVNLLKTRYPAALEAARTGNAPAFAHALAHGGYFTADPQVYASGLQQRLASVQSAQPVSAALGDSDGRGLGPLQSAALSGLLHAFRGSHDDA